MVGWPALYVVFANAAPQKGPRGLTAFIIPKETPGITIGKIEDKWATGFEYGRDIFEDVRVPAENILGKVGQGFLIAMRTFDRTRAAVGAAGVGLARAALESAVEYSKTRIQFGQPIATFEATAFKIAQMATELEAARLLGLESCLAGRPGPAMWSEFGYGQMFWLGPGHESLA